MGVIGNFPIERFKDSTNLLVTLCGDKYKNIWLNESNYRDIRSLIYKGSFMDCVEYLYGFIPEVLREYCRQFGLIIYTNNIKTIGNLSIMQAVFEAGVLDVKEFSLLKKIFLARGELIHSTLWDSKVYYKKLSWICDQLLHSDLDSLCKYIIDMCNKINKSYRVEGDKVLMVRDYKDKVKFSPSNNWK